MALIIINHLFHEKLLCENNNDKRVLSLDARFLGNRTKCSAGRSSDENNSEAIELQGRGHRAARAT